MHLLDVDVLLALAWPNHVHHAVAHAWFARARRDGWATCPVTESAFIQVSSSHRVTPDARTPAEAALLLHRMCQVGGHVFVADPVSLAERHEQVAALAHGSMHVSAAHLVLLAEEAATDVVTFDPDTAEMAARVDVPCVLLTL